MSARATLEQKDEIMKSFNTKLVLTALGLATLIATPALAQHRVHRPLPQAHVQTPITGYPNPVSRSGSEQSVESGAAFSTGY